MKPATAEALDFAKKHLERARVTSGLGVPSVSGREAYLAALAAARGLAFELRGKGPKTHKGVRVLLHDIVKDGAAIDRSLLAIFDQGFDLKVEADYGDPGAVTEEEARAHSIWPRNWSGRSKLCSQ